MENLRILIIGDEETVSLGIQTQLEEAGYIVFDTVPQGKDTLLIVEECNPGLIIIDMQSKGRVDAFETARVLKKQTDLPMICISENGNETVIDQVKSLKPAGYLLKPVKEKDLFSVIKTAKNRKEAERTTTTQGRLFSAILHYVNDGIVAIDPQLTIMFMNPVAAKMSGWTEEDAQGKPIQQVFSLIDSHNLSHLIPKALPEEDKPSLFRDVIMKSHHGNTIIVDGSITKIQSNEDEPSGYVMMLRDISEMKKLSATIDYQATHDTLTGLSNREGFTIKLQDLLEGLKRNGGFHTLMELDIDRFKVINETGGTAAGDELLRQVTDILRSILQRQDISARLGGDEFAVVLRDCMIEDAIGVAQRLQNLIQSHKFVWNKRMFPLSLSIGLVPLTDKDHDTHTVLAAADDACTMAKEEGGNGLNVFQSGDERYQIRRGQMQWVSRINEALVRDQFRLWYQLIDALQDPDDPGKIELLLRLENEDGTFSSPTDFIPPAERYGLIKNIDRWVVETAAKEWRRLKKKRHPITKRVFSVNLSGQTVLDLAFTDFIVKTCETYGVPPAAFCFEVTETVAMQDLTFASKFITTLREKGFTFSLDDFGSGFSSFSYLKNLPVDYLKIDGSIVKDIDENRVNYIMVESINSMCHVIGLKTIGEYARNEKVVKNLKKIGVNYAQGYSISEPAPLP
ncbi:EAL domain-containing protein [Breznakiella homolactica]|uniref:EAL domain-containing protein n=1 Tax=Breznakiella homolactica TaxID=2798577 RepID=A0A7T7XNK5_9SPIR|nr:EAL domain-containing protein [Breznakiella homolactica]QQO09593.1 EAL domain-containing protein [Breznakiella homolactica]